MMRGEPAQTKKDAVFLRDDSVGVSTEHVPRKIQRNGGGREYYCSLNRDWLEQLNICAKSESTLHSVSLGIQPVIVQHPAIIIQPARVLQEEGYDDV